MRLSQLDFVCIHQILKIKQDGIDVKNRESWKPSKYIFHKGQLIASRNPTDCGAGSRLMGDIIARFYQQNIPKFTKGALLDLGCGAAPLYGMYNIYCESVTCSDWQNTPHNNDYVDIYCNLTERLPFENEQFDTIILSDVLEHIPTAEALLMEMNRILSKGGHAIINVPFYYWIHEQPYDYYRYTEFALKRFANNAGFNLILLDTMGGVAEIVTDILAKYFLQHTGGKYISVFLQNTTSLFCKTKIGKRISRKTGKLFPLGYFLVIQKP